MAFEQPQFALGVVTLDDGSELLTLNISTPTARFECYLADPSNYRDVAATLHENIIKVGKEMARKSRLQVVKGGSDGLRTEVGKFGGPRSPR